MAQISIQNREQHQPEVLAFLQSHLAAQAWEFTLPKGSGNETYFARSQDRTCFVKLGVQAARYRELAALGLAPPVLAEGFLTDGTSILVQPNIAGRSPGRRDYQLRLEQFAAAIRQVHTSPALQQVLPQASSSLYRDAGWQALARLRQKWERFMAQVPEAAGFIDRSLDDLGQQVNNFQGAGLVASHNDICNANWLMAEDGQLYLLDLESMAPDDPAVDIGATLWWYYPPRLRRAFLSIAGYGHDAAFEKRMQVRMALHCLHILLPRPNSFDRFDPAAFSERLVDFRAILAGAENPQGYD